MAQSIYEEPAVIKRTERRGVLHEITSNGTIAAAVMVGAALLAWAAGFGKRWLRNAVIALYVFLTERQHMPALPWYRKLWFAVTFPLFDVIGRISTVIALFSHVDWKPIPHDCAAGIDEMQTAKTAIS